MKPMYGDLPQGVLISGDDVAWAVTEVRHAVHGMGGADVEYRYLLGRTWNRSLPIDVYVMLNPSRARHDRPDPTMRKCFGFSHRRRRGGFVIANRFAFSTPYVVRLVEAARHGVDIVGAHNGAAIAWALARPGASVIVAWGRLRPEVRPLLVQRDWDPDALCLGLTVEGFPKHPLMPSYETPFVRYADALAARV